MSEQDSAKQPPFLAVCINNRFSTDKPSCGGLGGAAIADALEAGIRERNLAIRLERLVCFGACYKGPNVRIVPGGAFHHHATLADVPGILDEAEARCGRAPDGDAENVPLAPGM
ncbi:MAG: (2Fe-2S) ferredoxin domain-containing protein [Rhodospirillales bacterium]